MSIETAAQDLQDQILSEQVDPVQLEQTVRDTNLAEPAKAELVQQIRAAGEVARDMPIPYRTSDPAQSPVSPLASQQGSFFSDSSMESFFNVAVKSRVTAPVSDTKAAELGFAVAVASGTDPVDMPSVAEEVRTDLSTVGHSVTVEQFLAQNKQDSEAAVYQGHWENMDFLGLAADQPADASALIKEAEEELKSIQAMNKHSRLIAEAVDRMTPEQNKVFKNLEFMMSEVMYQQAIEQTFTRRIADDNQNASLWNWVSATLNPLYAATSRADQGKLLGLISERIGSDPQNYVFKSDDSDAVVNYLLDPKIPVGEVVQRLEEVKSLLDQMDTEQLGVNPVWSAELMDVLHDDLMNYDQNVSMGNILDALDATVLGAPVANIVKRLKGAGQALGARLFGQLGSASKTLTTEQVRGIEQMLREAVDNAIPPPLQTTQSKVSTSVSAALTNRGSTLDALNAGNPAGVRSIVSNAVKEDLNALKYMGVEPEAIAERVVPNPSSGLGVTSSVVTGAPHKIDRLVNKFQQELQKQNVSDVFTKQEIQDVPQKWAQSVAAQSAGTLHPSHSSLIQTAEDGSLDVLGVFGGTVDGGYGTRLDAERAAQYLFGLDHKIKVRIKGSNQPLQYWDDVKDQVKPEGAQLEFFVEAKNTLVPNTSFANPFDKDYISPLFPGASYLQSWSRLISKDLFDGVTAYVDKGTRLASMQQQMLNPVLRMKGSDAETWTKVLMHGDENEQVFSSAAEASRVLGVKVNSRVWDAYKGTRAYYDSVAAVRQRSVYKNLDQNGFKSAYDSNGVLTDLNGQVHVRPLSDKPQIGARPEDGSNELFQSGNVWGDELYDLETGAAVKLTPEKIEEVYGSGDKIIVRLHREAEFTDGQLYDFAIVKTGKIKQLTKNPMNIRRGHVDVNYKGEDWWANKYVGGHKGGTSYKLNEVGEKTVNGIKVPREGTIGLYANRMQAESARAALIKQELDAGVDLAGAESKYPPAVLTREGEREFGLDTAGTFSGLPAHARKRGERVLGPNGTAEVLSIAESLSKSVGEVRRALSIDAVELQKRRFSQLYAKNTVQYDQFPTDFDRIVWSESAKAAGIPVEAKRAHQMIQNLDRAVSNKEFVLFMDHIEAYSQELINNGSKVFGPALKGLSKAQIDNELKKVAATLLIGFRVMYQVMANTAQVAFLFVQNPAQFSVNTIRRTLATALFGIPNLKIDSRLMEAVGATIFGGTPEQFKKHIQNLKESGVLRSAASQDMVALLGEGGKVEAGRHNLTSQAFWKRMVPGFGGGERVGKALMFPQHIATDIANTFAYNHAFSTVAAKDGIDAALTRTGRTTVAADARRLMWNQNRTDQFAYQQNAFSIQMMFFQHVHRMYNDLIVDPALRTFTGNKVGISKDGTNPYARTWAESVKTMFMMSGLFGAGVYPIVDLVKDDIGDIMKYKGVPPEAVSVFLDGVVSMGVENAVGEKMNVQSRFSPEGALKSMVEMMFTNDGGFQLGGPITHVWNTGKKLTRMGEAYWNAEPMDQGVWMKLLQSTAASVTSGTNDVFRATVAANINEYVDSSGRPIAQVTDTSWIPILFSVPPESVQSYYDTRTQTFNAEAQMLEVAKVANRMAAAMVGGVPDGRVNGDLLLDAVVQGMRAIELLSGENKIQAQEAKRVFATQLMFESDGILMKHADKITGLLSPEDAVVALKKLQSDNPELQEGIQFLIDALEYKP